MAQVFRKRTNFISKAIIIFVITGLPLFFIILGLWYRSPIVTKVGLAPKQPVPFSHKLHAGQLGMDCRYCHATVERSSFAGLPSTQTCMNCHSLVKADSPKLELVRKSLEQGTPIRWTRVNNLPDFVYFNHSIHINKGISCVSCHGRVDQMDTIHKTASLQMSWCLDCHRHPEKNLRPKNEVFNMSWQSPKEAKVLQEELMQQHAVKTKTDCSVCHR